MSGQRPRKPRKGPQLGTTHQDAEIAEARLALGRVPRMGEGEFDDRRHDGDPEELNFD